MTPNPGPYREQPYNIPLASTDHDMLVKLTVQMEEIHTAVMGNGKPGLVDDVSKLKSKMAFIQWAGALGAGTLLAAALKLTIH